MTTEKNTTIAKCPSCGTPATQPIMEEKCTLAKNSTSKLVEDLTKTCIIPDKFRQFHETGIGEDPCVHCQHNEVVENPGSYVCICQGDRLLSWWEIHVCPTCQTRYYVDSYYKIVKKLR